MKPVGALPRPPSALRRARGAAARLHGRRREVIAALWLIAKGYRILGFRLRAREAEIDLAAVKGRVLAIVEVKSRTDLAAALEAVGPDQRERLRRAGLALAANRPGLRGMSVRLDLVVFGRGGAPRHIRDAWSGERF